MPRAVLCLHIHPVAPGAEHGLDQHVLAGAVGVRVSETGDEGCGQATARVQPSRPSVSIR
jgi:hypothetical protein